MLEDALCVEAHRSSAPLWRLKTFGFCCLLVSMSLLSGSLVRAQCMSVDRTSTRSCFGDYNDEELTRLLYGTPANPLDAPDICDLIISTPAAARSVLQSSDCRGYRAEALALTFNIRRSALFGDGLLGEDAASCFDVVPFEIVLRCGDVFLPDESTPDPEDAVVVSEDTSVADLVELGSQFCELTACPGDSGDPCAPTLSLLRAVLRKINRSRYFQNDKHCIRLCPGDTSPPVLDCPQQLVTIECTGPDGTPITYNVEVSDNCDPGPRLVCTPPPGTMLPPGSRQTVRCEATDVRLNQTTCLFEVVVVDTTPPAINCAQSPIVVDCSTSGENDGAVVNYPAPVATDICDSNPSVVCVPPPGSFFAFGTTTVICTASDASGNQSQCDFEIQVVEQTPTTLICPPGMTVECTQPGGAVVSYSSPILSDSCDSPDAPICEPPSGSIFPLGLTIVTCSTLDHDGSPLSCEFVVEVVDSQLPTIICPGDKIVECDSPLGSAVLFEVMASDACDPDPLIECNPPSGSTFPPGVTVVNCRVTDASGNSAACTFSVNVVDTTAPSITCPQGPIRVSCEILGDAGAVVNYPAPAVVDNCDASVSAVCDRVSGSVFPLGTTTVNCTATDDAGNQSSCSFVVEVVDDAPPSLVCVESLTRECEGPDGAIVVYPTPVVADECGEPPTIECTPAAGSLFPMGDTLVTCVARDQSGNESVCTFTVTVSDTTAPSLLCPVDIGAECESPQGSIVNFNVLATDTCDQNPDVECIPASGSIFAPGLTTVNCTATDRDGNTSSCSFSVTVIDTTPPAISCSDDILAECSGADGTSVSFTTAAIDNCDGAVEVRCDRLSGSAFPIGATMVTCTSVDAAGNESRCEFEVLVVDTTAPDIVCASDVIVAECDRPGAGVVQFPLPVATDICDLSPTVTCQPPPGSVLPLGRSTIICSATDASGNRSTCSFEVNVVDTVAPQLNCSENILRECSSPQGTVVEYPFPTASDTCDLAPNLICLPPPGTVFPVGTTEVRCTADDQSGNMISCTFEVTVVDTTPPDLNCPADISISCTSPAGSPVSYVVTATDVCDPTPEVTCIPPSGNVFPLGVTAVTCRAVDRHGNESICEFSVTVVDELAPVIQCPKSFELECIENGLALVEYPRPSVADACDPEPGVTCEPPSGTRLPPGAHTILCTAVDASGNESTCQFTVTVVDTTAPELICPPEVSVECEGSDGAIVEYDLPVANDACDGQPPVECVPASGSLFAIGSTEVVCRSRDAAGNETTCSFLVVVSDSTAPEINCPEPIIVECDGSEGSVVEFDVSAIDTCDPSPQVQCDPPSGSVFAPGQTTVNCEVVDQAGNVATCSFSVSVVDTTAPDLVCPEDMTVTCEPNPEINWQPGQAFPPEACTAVVDYAVAEASDACQEKPVQLICTPGPGSRLELGTHEVVCRAIDAAGNESSCTFLINVVLSGGQNPFMRGDANGDGTNDIADAITVVRFLFLGTTNPECLKAVDANDDGDNGLADAIYILNYRFQNGREPPPPFDLCGFDPTPDSLTCERYRPCE